jgi:hypothetical protein
MGIGCRLDLGRESNVPGSDERVRCFVGSGSSSKSFTQRGVPKIFWPFGSSFWPKNAMAR